MFPGNKEASSCWNCGRRGHVFSKCDKKLDLTRIVSEKAKLYSKKNGYRQGTKRVLFELVSGLNNLCKIDDEADNLESVKAFFGDRIESDDESSSSDEEKNGSVDLLFNEADKSSRTESDVDF